MTRYSRDISGNGKSRTRCLKSRTGYTTVFPRRLVVDPAGTDVTSGNRLVIAAVAVTVDKLAVNLDLDRKGEGKRGEMGGGQRSRTREMGYVSSGVCEL
jgi:hypothetical protein